MTPSRSTISLQLLAFVAMGGFASDRGVPKEPTPAATVQPAAQRQMPTSTPEGTAATNTRGGQVTLTLLDGRVRYRIPAHWDPRAGRLITADREGRWHNFPDRWATPAPPPAPGDGLSADIFAGSIVTAIDAYRLEGSPSLDAFSRAHRTPAGHGTRILRDTRTGDLRVIVSTVGSVSGLECFKVDGDVGVVFGLAYNTRPRRPRAWVTELLAQARSVCSSITIDRRR